MARLDQDFDNARVKVWDYLFQYKNTMISLDQEDEAQLPGMAASAIVSLRNAERAAALELGSFRKDSKVSKQEFLDLARINDAFEAATSKLLQLIKDSPLKMAKLIDKEGKDASARSVVKLIVNEMEDYLSDYTTATNRWVGAMRS